MSDKNTPDNSFNREDPELQELSALVDGEINGDLEHLLGRATENGASKAAWHRYHLVRDVMQRDYHPALGSDFAARVSNEIAAENNFDQLDVANVVNFADRKPARPKTAAIPPAHRARRTWLPVAGLGLAASVAAAGFMAWQLTGQQDAGDSSSLTVAQVAPERDQSNGIINQPILLADAIVPTVYKEELGTRWLATTAEPRNQKVEQRLNSLLINHLEDSTMGRVQGMLAHSRVVAYDSVTVNESF